MQGGHVGVLDGPKAVGQQGRRTPCEPLPARGPAGAVQYSAADQTGLTAHAHVPHPGAETPAAWQRTLAPKNAPQPFHRQTFSQIPPLLDLDPAFPPGPQALEEAISRGLPRVEAGAQGEHKLQRGYLPAFTYRCVGRGWGRDGRKGYGEGVMTKMPRLRVWPAMASLPVPSGDACRVPP